MKITKNTCFKLFTFIFPVKGYRRSLLFNSSINKIEFISNDFYTLLIYLRTLPLLKASQKAGIRMSESIDQIKLLVDAKCGFFCNRNDLVLFPEINTYWSKPAFITNAIIDYNEQSSYSLSGVIKELLHLHCLSFQFRFYCISQLNYLATLLEGFSSTYASKIELIIKDDNYSSNDIVEFSNNNPRIISIIIHSAKKDAVYSQPFCHIVFSKRNIEENSFCGEIDLGNFCLSIDMYSESLNYNSCLNRKVGIDVDGNIKNCPSMEHSFGNLKQKSIHEIIGKREFQKLWKFNKDKIDKCKDCEFRYFCVDCRAFLKKEKMYSAPLKCKYDPYEAKWNDWNQLH